MIIRDNKAIKDIKQEFSGLFAGLKLEFYEGKHHPHKGSALQSQYSDSLLIGEIRGKNTEGNLEIDPEMTVAQLEGLFDDMYGLHVQVFRKSNTLWLQTISTDNWTLKEQNRKGINSIQDINR